MCEHTKEPWTDDLTPLIKEGDWRVKLGGAAPLVPCRILSEGNFQRAKLCVNFCAGEELPDGGLEKLGEDWSELHALYEAAKAEVETLTGRCGELERVFLHTHVAKHVMIDGKDKLLDECKACGLDIRDSIHERLQPSRGEGR